jgi:hypothetical protein
LIERRDESPAVGKSPLKMIKDDILMHNKSA